MKAIVAHQHAPGAVELREVPCPTPGPDEVLLRVGAAGVCGSDLHLWHCTHSFEVTYPRVLGHEFAGTVAAVGNAVTGFAPGDRVASETAAAICGTCALCRTGRYNVCPHRLGFGILRDGGMAEFVTVPARALHHLPDGLSLEDGAMIEPACVGFQAAAVKARVTPGDVVAVIGPGPIGLMALQCARLFSPTDLVLIGLRQDEARLQVGLKVGATRVIRSDEEDPLPVLRALGDGLGPDVIFDAVGISSTLRLAVEAVRPDGQIVKIGWGPDPVDFSLDPLVQKAARIQASFSHTWEVWERVIRLVAAGQLSLAPLREVFRLEDWEACFERMDSLAIAKAVLVP